MTPSVRRSDKASYGWAIVGAMLFVQTISSGLGFYNMSVYMTEFSKSLSLPLANVSFAVSLFFVVGGVAGMYVAKLLERIHVRWIMVGGAVLAGASLSAVGLADSLWQIYVLFTLFGIGNTGVSLVIATTLITQWFPGPNRSIALSTASTGLSLGGVVVTPATAYLFNTIGAPATIPWLGLAFVVLIVPVALWVVRPAPSQITALSLADEGRWTYSSAIRTRFFILLAVGYVFCQGAQVGGISHLYNRVDELAGFAAAASAVQTLTICSILGRFAGGWLVTRVPIRGFTLFNLIVQMTGLTLIGVAEDAQSALIGAAVFGVSVGNLLMLQPLWLAEAFPGSVYPRVFALANACAVMGVAMGPFLLGLTYDLANYTVAYGVALVTSALAWLFILFAGSKPQVIAEPQAA